MLYRSALALVPALMLMACDAVRKPDVEREDPAARATELGRPVAPTDTFTDLPPLEPPAEAMAQTPPPAAAAR